MHKYILVLKSKKGFTIVELLISLTLLGIILAGIYTLFFFAQNSFNSTNTRSAINQQLNHVLMQLERDIRSASKPNRDTHSIRVASEKQLHIYTYDQDHNQYIRIEYKLNGSNDDILVRGWVACDTPVPPADQVNPEYGTVDNWQTMVEEVVKNEGDRAFGFFDDSTSDTNERRTIKITLIANDPKKPLKKPIAASRTITSRSIEYP